MCNVKAVRFLYRYLTTRKSLIFCKTYQPSIYIEDKGTSLESEVGINMKKYLRASDQCSDEVDEVKVTSSEGKDPIEGQSSSVQASTSLFYDNDTARDTFMSAIQKGIISEEEAIKMLVEYIGTETAISSLLYDVWADDIEDMFDAAGLIDKLDQPE